ncbi:bifunctional lytic transglycosylase/C40 family peptidase [Nocardiopsis sp. EMB25]|uniref:C40 family peptidase n=1 Tax=Nocardiopsis sp. EMB25 TaxID=2835867 RepID=UPI00228460C5|nr:bifunctional lytic transglycosylase/C40 family peptidase [Nocardiopsis sp. EMB25]MCY9785184.1 bifunctional lytic transglycosylase/C40 family peptidase [Nocardiopsis sp. EMB25]
MIRLAMGAAGAVFLVVPVFIGALSDTEHRAAPVPGQVEGIPDVVLGAYAQAAGQLEVEYPGCVGMTWPVLAGIGKVESNHAAGHKISSEGRVHPPIIGPRLDGSGAGGNTTAHTDRDGGVWDGDVEFDRAVGPMQFLPSTWASHGFDATGDGVADPHNVVDAAWSAAVYLCVSNPHATVVDFGDEDDLEAALLRYNRSASYVEEVRGHIDAYAELAAHSASAPGSGTEASSAQGRVAVEWALAQVGKPYLWGGTGPGTFDCSGLVMRAWEAAGVGLPRVTTDQVHAGRRVGLKEVRPGDLLFYDTGAPGGSPSHVTMYVGDGQMVNAPGTGRFVRVEPVNGEYYRARFVAAVRPG